MQALMRQEREPRVVQIMRRLRISKQEADIRLVGSPGAGWHPIWLIPDHHLFVQLLFYQICSDDHQMHIKWFEC